MTSELWPATSVTLDTLPLVTQQEECVEEMAPVSLECGVDWLQLVKVRENTTTSDYVYANS